MIKVNMTMQMMALQLCHWNRVVLEFSKQQIQSDQGFFVAQSLDLFPPEFDLVGQRKFAHEANVDAVG